MTHAVLVVGAHPDDEVLLAGGVLAAAAADGQSTAVACLTRGELGPVSDRALLRGRTLGDVRADELRAACAELGVARVRGWRRGDGMLAWAPRRALARQLAAEMARVQPEAVVSFGADGLYGHPDHVAAGAIARLACELYDGAAPAPAAAWPGVAFFEAVWPTALSRRLLRALRARGLPHDLWGMSADEFGASRAEMHGAVPIDVRGAAVTKLRALRAHRTQLGDDHALRALPDGLAPVLLGHEWLRRVNAGGRGGGPSGWLERRWRAAGPAAGANRTGRRRG